MTTTDAQSADIKQALKKITAISTLPEVTARIIATVEDPRSSAKQLHQIVMHDPSLVTRVLRMVNSSFYGLPGQVASVDRAIVMLGLHAIKSIAVAASVGQLFRVGRLTEQFTAADLWRHCVAVGVAARALAKRLNLPLVEEAFLGGMIHDVGLLVTLQMWPAELKQVCAQAELDGTNFIDIEQKIMNTDHQALGAALMDLWKFPKSCQIVAAYHHRPMEAPEASRQLAALVHVADTLCAQQQVGFYLTANHQPLDEATVAPFGITLDAVEAVRAELPTLLESADNILNA